MARMAEVGALWGAVVPERDTEKGRGKQMQVKETSNRGAASPWAGRTLAALVTLVALGGPLAVPAGADFVLWNDEQLMVDSFHATGVLNDQSRVEIISTGRVDNNVAAYDNSSVAISGGSVNWLRTYHDSSVAISDGSVGWLDAHNSSSVNISGGGLGGLYAGNDSRVDISGGGLGMLDAYDGSNITIHGYDFGATGGLSLDGDLVLGTGLLTGRWFDGTAWTIAISYHVSGATIRTVVPEPATCILLGVGLGLAGLLRRRRTPCPVGGGR